MLNDKKKLNSTEIWHLSAEALHAKDYIEKYVEVLSFIVRDKDLSILDTASGSGFPTVNLYRAGFTKIEASDADSQSVAELKNSLKNKGINIPVHEGVWQELDKKINKKFNVIINTDNSLVYMDGWVENANIVYGIENIKNRISLVLKSFYNLLEKDGFVIIGLGKHYNKIAFTTEKFAHIPFDIIKNEKKIHIDWRGSTNWSDKNRTLNWALEVWGEDIEGVTKKKGYLITKDELVEIMRTVGFKKVHIFEPDGTRDNLLVGIK